MSEVCTEHAKGDGEQPPVIGGIRLRHEVEDEPEVSSPAAPLSSEFDAHPVRYLRKLIVWQLVVYAAACLFLFQLPHDPPGLVAKFWFAAPLLVAAFPVLLIPLVALALGSSSMRPSLECGVVIVAAMCLLTLPLASFHEEVVQPGLSAFHEREALQLIKAIELYTADHGAPPQELWDLVPAYAEMPRDGFLDGKAEYVREGPDRWYIKKHVHHFAGVGSMHVLRSERWRGAPLSIPRTSSWRVAEEPYLIKKPWEHFND